MELFDVIGSIVSIRLPQRQEYNGESQKLIEIVLQDPDQRRVKYVHTVGEFCGCNSDLEVYKKYPNFMSAAVLFCKPKIYRGYDLYLLPHNFPYTCIEITKICYICTNYCLVHRTGTILVILEKN
ncbi:unnamed protein product [Cuscuta epithymum]|uniref:Uncharacterized protein n=1 Tax=Cuscuta epithymum TaxID=186058 RepID=A0AAV0C5N7_9ASTE|nr:unnamed protein product [Cuscuta epithymum]